MNTPTNYLHLDFKGLMPSEDRLIQWLNRLPSWGYGGVVLEYEDRLPWASWPKTYRPGYSLEGWGRIWREAARLGLEVIPLVQTFGHLEWLLKHPQYAGFREAGLYNLLCPLHPEIMPRLEQWLDEVIALHRESRYIHVGLDEVYNLCSCPRCVARTERLPDGKLGVYLDHVGRVCRHVLDRGKRPILWADMFLRHDRVDLAKQLPEGAILCHWDYKGDDPISGARKLLNAGRSIFGASGIRCFWSPWHTLMSSLESRLDNVRKWRDFAGGEGSSMLGLMHTTWGRPSSLTHLYGPWEGWLPVLQQAAAAGDALSRPMREGMPLLEKGMESRDYHQIVKSIEDLSLLHSDDPFEEQALRWWKLALRHYHELRRAEATIGDQGLRAVKQHVGLDPWSVRLKEQEHADVLAHLTELESEIRAFFQDNRLDGADEFVGSRIGNLRRIVAAPWMD